MSANLLHQAIVGTMPLVPRPIVWRFSQRYIAGTDLGAACEAVRVLNAEGSTATIDVLGEDSTDDDEVNAALQLYFQTLRDIDSASLQSGISVKLSELGLRYDIERCESAMEALLTEAAKYGAFVRIDMEDSTVTTDTLQLYIKARETYDRVGVAIQSCLRRSEDDVIQLLSEGQTDVRLCKGIYLEPEEISYRDADDIRDSYNRILDLLLEDATARVGIATHDPLLVQYAIEALERCGTGKDRYEFQMLLGVAGPLRRKLLADGHAVRVYVPFGELWYKYSMRRLRENPNMVGHIIKNLFASH
jgi:proline dehydrogenase